MFLTHCLSINLSMGYIVRISTNMDKSRPKLAKNVGKNMKMLVPGPVGPQYALFCYGSPHHCFPWVKIHTWRMKLSQYVCFSPKSHKEMSKSIKNVKKRQNARSRARWSAIPPFFDNFDHRFGFLMQKYMKYRSRYPI